MNLAIICSGSALINLGIYGIIWFLQVASFLASSAPLAICIILNWDKYTGTPDQTVKLCFGGALGALLIALKAVGKLKIPSAIACYGIVFIMAYLLDRILTDLMLLSGMALLGELLDIIFFSKAIKNTREQILVGKTADATATQVEEVFKKYAGRV